MNLRTKSRRVQRFVKQRTARMRPRETLGRLRLMDIHRKTATPRGSGWNCAAPAVRGRAGCPRLHSAPRFRLHSSSWSGVPTPPKPSRWRVCVAPALLALLAYTSIPLEFLEQAALAIFAALIGYLAALTGGVVSPLVVWFALVPAEAALAGGRPAVLRAAIAASVALLAVAGIEAAGALPISRLPGPPGSCMPCRCSPR